MFIIPYVCAEFRDRSGNRIHRITPDMRGCLTEVPDAVRQDLLFGMLVEDGSIKVPQNDSQKKVLEQDPMVGVAADGRSAVLKEEKPGKSGKAPRAEEKAATGGQKQ